MPLKYWPCQSLCLSSYPNLALRSILSSSFKFFQVLPRPFRSFCEKIKSRFLSKNVWAKNEKSRKKLTPILAEKNCKIVQCINWYLHFLTFFLLVFQISLALVQEQFWCWENIGNFDTIGRRLWWYSNELLIDIIQSSASTLTLIYLEAEEALIIIFPHTHQPTQPCWFNFWQKIIYSKKCTNLHLAQPKCNLNETWAF